MNNQTTKDEIHELRNRERSARQLGATGADLVKEIAEQRAKLERSIGGRGPTRRAFERITQRIAEELLCLTPDERVRVIDASVEHLITSSAELYADLKERRAQQLAADAPAKAAA